MVSDHMLISILSVSVEPLEMLCAEAVDALAPQDLKPKDFLSPLRLMCVFITLQEVKFILIIQFCLCHFLRSLARLGRCELAVASPLGFKPSVAYLQLLANLSYRHLFLALALKWSLVLS